MMNIRLFLLLLLATALHLPAEMQIGQLFEMAKQFELAATPEAPEWSKRSDRPLFRVAWLSDLHITDAASLKICRAAMTAAAAEKPDAVFITGDNCGMAAVPGKNSDGVARHKFLKHILDGHFRDIPLCIIPGDNWPYGFSKVFGSQCRSFSIKGYRFISLAPAAQGRIDGCATLGDETWQWLDRELEAASGMPVMLITHYPLMPASFLDAPRLRQRIQNTSVTGVLSGHLHLDLSGRINKHCTQWMAPAIGRSHRPAFKILSFYDDAVISVAYEWQKETNKFLPVNKYLRITLPEHLKIKKTSGGPQPSAMPPAEIRIDTGLDARAVEMRENVQKSIIQFGMQRLMSL